MPAASVSGKVEEAAGFVKEEAFEPGTGHKEK